jgi:hypothetical protein
VKPVAALELTGIVRPFGTGTSRSVAGFRVEATVIRSALITPDDDATIDLPSAGNGVVDADGNFRFAIGGEGDPRPPVTITVSTPEGVLVHRRELTLEQAAEPLTIRVKGSPPLDIVPAEDPAKGGRVTMTGRVVDERGKTVVARLPVVLWGVVAGSSTAHPIVVTQTQTGGFFSADWVSTALSSAFGRVAGSDAIPIALDDAGRLPRHVLLVLDVPDAAPDGSVGAPVLAPNPTDLTGNPAEFSQDLGRGCIDLTTPNRTVEEFVYMFVVRTSEPDVQGVTFGRRRLVPPHFFAGLLEATALHEAFTTGRATSIRSADFKELVIDVDSARRLVNSDEPPTVAEIKRAGWLAEVGWLKDLIGGVAARPPVRQPMDASHPIDWDDTPTVYQAITIARGHLLEFREIWRANGYSLGDLLHSLPLAPGQRRRVAVVDWERRTTTTREEALEFEEQLNAFTGRDRDVSEIVGSRLSEEVAAGSSNTTWGVAGGIGAGFIGSGFGIFGGVAGSHGGSESNAWQDASRSFAGDSLQSLRDRVMQRSSAVRDQRSTVVQTAAQGETMRAETEVVANYNHSHAMTVEYFEVLRHFLVTHELADVRECLFVPMPIREFDRAKALRWQTPLNGRLTDRALLPAFDAIRRIADNWEGWDYPQSRYSEEAPEILEGELRISFVLPRPRDAEDGGFQLENWAPYTTWLWGSPYEIWTAWIQEGIAEINAENIARRDRQFREKIAPEIAKKVVDRLRFWYVTDDGGEVEVPLDATLVSRYAEGTPLYVTVRPWGALPPIAREKVSQFKITLDTQFVPPFNVPLQLLPADAQVIVHSGKMRYQTEHKQFLLFNEERILNDLSEFDAVFIPTPTQWAERRNPREEDRRLADRLLAHLNNALEYYHQVIWMWLDAERRFILLDGILVPGLGGKSVASVVENRVIGIAGNSMIFPVAPGIRIDPRVNTESEGDLRDLYAADAPPPIRVSVPTRGVYAEAILGDCNGSELIDDSRYWRWTDAGMLAPPEIAAVDTGSRADAEQPLTATPLPKPLVSIQNAPELPAPVGLGDVFKVLAKPDLFTDITGLEGTQKNARAAFDSALSAASAVATEAAGLAKQNITATSGERMLERIAQARSDGLLTPGVAQDLSQKVLGAMVGKPDETADKKADSPASDPQVQKAIDKAAQSDKAAVKVSTADETLEMSFDGGDTKVGGGANAIGVLETDGFVDELVIRESASGSDDAYVLTKTTMATLTSLRAAYKAKVSAIESKFLIPNKADPTKYQLYRRLRISYPADPKDAKKVAGKGRIPLAVLVHGQHQSWQGGGEVRNHDGYKFLQDHLAKQGIASVSVDTNAANFFGSLVDMRANMILAAIETLRTMDKDPASRFHDRLDFDRIGLMGHSRGGDAVVQAALFNRGNTHGVIKAVASLAPTDFTGALADGSKRNVMDAATAGFYFVLYGGLDGDVSGYGGVLGFGGTGFRHYDRATAPKAMVYVPFCDHNRFNDIWSADESGVIAADVARLHSRPDHRQLLIEYVGGLFEWKLLGATGKAILFNGRGSNSLGHDVSQQWEFGAQTKVVEDFEKATGTIGTRTVKSADVGRFADVQVNAAKLAPNTSHQTSILAVQANLPSPPPTVLELDFPAGQRDWSGYELLSFRLGTWFDIDTQAKINAGNPLPPFDVVLIDGAAKTATVNAAAFTTPDIPGKPVFHKVDIADPGDPPDIQNATLHRLATTAITLPGLGLKLDDIRKLQIIPAAGFKQRIFFDSLRLVQL